MDQEVPRLKSVWKSLFFWLGALIGLFLIWVWVDSQGHRTRLGWTATPRAVQMTVWDSKVTLGISLPTVESPVPGEWVWERGTHMVIHDPPGSEGGWFAAFNAIRSAQYQSGTLYFDGSDYDLPLWFILLLWLGCWLLGFRLWRRWQQRRLSRRVVEDPSS